MGTTQPIRDKKELSQFMDYYYTVKPNKRNYTLIVLGLHTALRISDVLHLKWEEVYNFDLKLCKKHLIVLEHKTGKYNDIALCKCVKDALLDYFEEREPKPFVSIIEKYPDIVWISGHSHEDYSLGYNYSNNNGTSCNMIHNSSVGNPTHLKDNEGKKEIDYTFFEDNSQGYYVQAFGNSVIFNGSNLVTKKIYPAYSYIIKGNTQGRYTVKENYTMTDSDKTSGNVNSILENVKCYLAVNYQYSSYDQYQQLKKTYFEYKTADTKKMTQVEKNVAYSKLSTYLTNLRETIKSVPMD